MTSIETAEMARFVDLFEAKNSPYDGLRFGQAFYNHFKLERMSDQRMVNKIYSAADRKAASAIICQTFTFS